MKSLCTAVDPLSEAGESLDVATNTPRSHKQINLLFLKKGEPLKMTERCPMRSEKTPEVISQKSNEENIPKKGMVNYFK